MRLVAGTVLGAVMMSLPLFAQSVTDEAAEVPKRAAPDYFLQALTDLNLAEALATQCELLSIDPAKTALLTDEVLARLEADGFDPADPVTQMLDARDELMALQQGFVDRHGLAGADRDAYCAAGATDLVAQVGPGAYLIAVPAQ